MIGHVCPVNLRVEHQAVINQLLQAKLIVIQEVIVLAFKTNVDSLSQVVQRLCRGHGVEVEFEVFAMEVLVFFVLVDLRKEQVGRRRLIDTISLFERPVD